jgi:hypothetical protein
MEHDGETVATVRIRQAVSTTVPSFFRMPLDLCFMGPAIDTTVTVWNDSSDQTWQFTFAGLLDSVTLDPDSWILKAAMRVPMSSITNPVLPTRVELTPNYPNPFNATTWVRFGLPERSHVLLEVFDMAGRRMALLADQVMAEGVHEVPWRSDAPSGVYVSRLVATTFRTSETHSRKMILIR